MIFRFLASATLVCSLIGLAGCKQKASSSPGAGSAGSTKAQAAPITFPELGASRLIQPGIRFQEATLQRGNLPMRVWYYEPEKAAGKLALVLVPPAGSTLFAGMELGEGDRAEHYPYVRAGFAVASFDLDGHVPDSERANNAALLKAAQEFRDAQAGLVNAGAALDFILAKVPNINPDQVYIAGHSSAATLALLVAEQEPRIKACAAFAPITDVEARLAEVAPQLDRALPGYREFLQTSSPKTHAETLKCPVLLFHADDDENVPVNQCTDFAAQLKKANPHVTLVSTPKGGHYDSMIREGIPKAIAWFRQIPPDNTP
jgi:dipeptidyl aminopeptidase/acylaminoacyl peptidase